MLQTKDLVALFGNLAVPHHPLSPSIPSSFPSFHPLPLGSMDDPQKRGQENSSESSERTESTEGTESGLSTTQG